MRDDFTKTTIEKLAHRAGYMCSKPNCGRSTRGAASDGQGTINVGVAAHITAASPKGPRYDPSLTREQRRAYSNGLWLCETHGKLVDSDESHFTVEELLKWKRLAERRSFLEVVSPRRNPLGRALVDDDNLQAVFDLFLGYSRLDLTAFQQSPGWPSHPIALNLRLLDGDSAEEFAVSGLALGIEVYDQVAVIAAPGTGKTTTLLQLAEAILTNAASVPVFIPLSEWATGSESFFQSLLRRSAFKDARQRQLELLAQHGKLVLILDGWNELDKASKRRVRNDLKALKRDYPDIHTVVSSRHRDFDIPIDGPVVEVELLSEDQQLELAKSLRGADGESLMDHAWRTPGLRELVSIPLYLTALLEQAPGGSIPTTKAEVLQSFVAELEKDRDKLATLHEALHGFHTDFLEEIAVETTAHETVTLSEAQARAAVNTVQEQLKAENQIAQLSQPNNALDALVNAHMLVRSGAEAGSVSFQHQQFQEWFASLRVQKLMLSASQGDDDSKEILREKILDIPVWEEAILFACERLSRADEEGKKATASAILETLGIDPLLAAEMIRRSPDSVWQLTRDEVISFVRKWHKPGRVDRAVNFMIDTARPEFSEFVWPLISDADDQVHLRALRAGRRFRTSVLGSDAEERIKTLPENVRNHVISEIASYGGMDGIELATKLAKVDKSSEVKKSVIESLMFRRADRFAKEILQSAPDEVWRSLAQKWYSHEFSDPEVSERIQEEADKLATEEADPARLLNRILAANVHDPEAVQQVRELVESIDFSDKNRDDRWVIHRAYELYPEPVVTGLLKLLEQGKPVPFQADEMLRTADVVIDDGPLADCVLKQTGDGKTAATAVSVMGPKTVGILIDQIFEVYARIRVNEGRHDKTLSDEHLRLKDLVSGSKVDSVAQAVLERAQTDNPDEIYILADLISRHGGGVERDHLRFSPETQGSITVAVQRWAEVLLASSEATLAQFAEIAQAVERLGSPELVPVLLKLLAEDLKRRKQAQKEWLEARKQGRQIQNDSHMSWTLQYRRAFAAIGDQQTINAMKTYLRDLEFGFDAAVVLKLVWQDTQPKEDEPSFLKSWPDFSVVPESYRQRQSGSDKETHPFVDDIIGAIDDLIKPGAAENDLLHALKLSTVAFSMPYADKRETIDALLKLPIPAAGKKDFLTVLVLSGEAISSDIVIEGIDDLLEEAKSNPWKIQEQDGWRLKDWLRLLPFTDRPAAILEVLDRAEAFRADPWNLRTLLLALGYAPSAEAEKVLLELAKRDERFLKEHEWLAAMTNRSTNSTTRALLDFVCDATPTSGLDRTYLGKKLSELISSDNQFRRDVYDRYTKLKEGPGRAILEYAIAEAADTEGVLLLVHEGAARNKPIRRTVIPTALRNVLVEHTPMESSGMYQTHSLPAQELRKRLFHMATTGSAAEVRLANDCLCTIDEIRDDYGYVDSEPRHPDIKAGVPWPLLEMEVADA